MAVNLPKIQSGYHATAALDIDGGLWVAGNNDSGQQMNSVIGGDYAAHQAGGPYVDLGFGAGQHGLVVDAAGAVFGWGENADAQLGQGSESDPVPYLVAVPVPPSKYVATGDYQSFCVTNDDVVMGWGYGQSLLNGQPNGTGKSTVYTPKVILSGVGEIANIYATYEHATITTTTGDVWTWGGTQFEDTWSGSIQPTKLTVPVGVIKATRDAYRTVLLTASGDLYVDGVVVAIPAKVVDFAITWGDGYALDENGDVWSITSGVAAKITIPKAFRIGYNDGGLIYLKADGYTSYSGSSNSLENSPMFLGLAVQKEFPRFYGWANQDMYSMADSSTDVTYDGDGVGLGSNDGELIFYSSKGEVMLYIEGTADFEVSARFTSYRDAACTQVIEDINSFDNPELFEYTTDFAKWKPYPKAGIIPQGGESVRALLTVGPNRKVWIKSTIGAE